MKILCKKIVRIYLAEMNVEVFIRDFSEISAEYLKYKIIAEGHILGSHKFIEKFKDKTFFYFNIFEIKNRIFERCKMFNTNGKMCV